MKNKDEMPDVVFVDKDWCAYDLNVAKDGRRYHADHIVQRLEAEKAELVNVIMRLKNMSGVYTDAYNLANKTLQKHKGE